MKYFLSPLLIGIFFSTQTFAITENVKAQLETETLALVTQDLERSIDEGITEYQQLDQEQAKALPASASQAEKSEYWAKRIMGKSYKIEKLMNKMVNRSSNDELSKALGKIQRALGDPSNSTNTNRNDVREIFVSGSSDGLKLKNMFSLSLPGLSKVIGAKIAEAGGILPFMLHARALLHQFNNLSPGDKGVAMMYGSGSWWWWVIAALVISLLFYGGYYYVYVTPMTWAWILIAVLIVVVIIVLISNSGGDDYYYPPALT